MRIDRRQALGLIGAGAATTGCATAAPSGAVAFRHGVAAGDPTREGAILWTRVSGLEASGGQAEIRYEVSETDDFDRVFATGRGTVSAERDWTFKPDVRRLSA